MVIMIPKTCGIAYRRYSIFDFCQSPVGLWLACTIISTFRLIGGNSDPPEKFRIHQWVLHN
jgi:hypothetical protein